MSEQFNLPAGEYVVSDACYVMETKERRDDLAFYGGTLGTKSWDESGEHLFEDGSVGIHLPTAYGDGSWALDYVFADGAGQSSVCADAGNISIIPRSQCVLEVQIAPKSTIDLLKFSVWRDMIVTVHERGVWQVTCPKFPDVFMRLDTSDKGFFHGR